MTREDVLQTVKDIGERQKKPVPIRKYKRTKIVQEEIVEAFRTPVPSAIEIKGKPRQVEKDNWVVIHEDGTFSTYTDEEFNKVFEVIGLGKTFEEAKDGEAKTDE